MEFGHFKINYPCEFTERSESFKRPILSPAEVEDLCFRSLASRAAHRQALGGA